MREVIQWDHTLYIHINDDPLVSYLWRSRLLYLPSNNILISVDKRVKESRNLQSLNLEVFGYNWLIR